MLILDVEFLRGVCVACNSPGDAEPEFPPQVDRVFSAFVASLGSRRSRRHDEQEALEWLECLEPPQLYASAYGARTAPPVYVPTNDPERAGVLPPRRLRYERRFPTATPTQPIVSYEWADAHPPHAIFDALQLLAHRTSYLGHSLSLVRCFFRSERRRNSRAPEVPARRRVYRGRLAELDRDYQLQRRPSRGATIHSRPRAVPRSANHWGGRYWHVFADAGGHCPDLRRIAVVARAFRSLLLSTYGGCEAPEVLSGHAPGSGAVSVKPHLAVLPLADVGWRWSDGHMMGIALCLPGRGPGIETEIFQVLAHLSERQRMGRRHDSECRDFRIDLPGNRCWHIVRQLQPREESLKPQRYLRSARSWATVTPLVIDRTLTTHGNKMRQAEMAQMIVEACTHVGLPRPTAVVPAGSSAIRGSPPARRARVEPPWMDWATAPYLLRRELTHATLQFAQPVEGPVVLGAGRHIGLGLCLPLEEDRWP